MSVDTYPSFAALAAREVRGSDYDLDVQLRLSSRVAVIAPHGGGIEPETSRIAQSIAGAEFSFYSFRGLKRKGNRSLHITGHHFDEPECLRLLARHEWVVAIHGCAARGERVFLGGLDDALKSEFVAELTNTGITLKTSNHPFLGLHPRNVCNRGSRHAGVQFELSLPFRRGKHVAQFVDALRRVLARRQNQA